jgi:hypothetical protein
MTDLSPQAQAVLDAVGDLYELDIPEDRDIMIATLRAASKFVSAIEVEAGDELLAIAAELEGKGNG